MSRVGQAERERRVLLRTATAKDASLTQAVLARADLDSHVCTSTAELAGQLREGAGALILAEETLCDAAFGEVLTQLQSQEPWSDLPVLILARAGATSTVVLKAMEQMVNVTVIERPLRIPALISTVASALRARQRQYQVRALLAGLAEADRRKTEFLATLAHELRNPLAPLSTALAVVSRPETPPADASACFGMMRRQIDHMVRLIDDLMEVSRITRGKVELRTAPVALDQVIRDAVEISRPLIDASRHELRLDLPAGDWRLEGDAVRLTQVFANLLNNAAKYTPPGGRIKVLLEAVPGGFRVSVRDSGIGLPPDMLSEIFGIFVQIPRNTRVAQGGLGIGLTLVKSLVDLHGGRVQALSEGPGHGTEVRVELPATVGDRPPAPVEPPTAAATPGATVARRVLVVDDNRDAADSLAQLLGALGAQAFVAYDAFEAIDVARRVRPDVAVLDIGMPVMDGCELAQRLRADRRLAGLRLVALSGWGQTGDRERVRAAGFDHHLLKPADPARLVGLINAAPP